MGRGRRGDGEVNMNTVPLRRSQNCLLLLAFHSGHLNRMINKIFRYDIYLDIYLKMFRFENRRIGRTQCHKLLLHCKFKDMYFVK